MKSDQGLGQVKSRLPSSFRNACVRAQSKSNELSNAMGSVMGTLTRLYYKLFWYFFCSRLQLVRSNEIQEEFKNITLKTHSGGVLSFVFHRIARSDYEFRENKLYHGRRYVYSIGMKLQGEFPVLFVQLRDCRLIYDPLTRFVKDENHICEMLLASFLLYIESELV